MYNLLIFSLLGGTFEVLFHGIIHICKTSVNSNSTIDFRYQISNIVAFWTNHMGDTCDKMFL